MDRRAGAQGQLEWRVLCLSVCHVADWPCFPPSLCPHLHPARPTLTSPRLAPSPLRPTPPLPARYPPRSQWRDEDGKDRKWEVAVRKTTGSGGVDGSFPCPPLLAAFPRQADRHPLVSSAAVAIAALLRHPSKPLSIPIILQYRPPVKAICVELPAGLIDRDEDPATTAVRELHEETGYGGDEFEGRIKVVDKSGVIVSDPGMSNVSRSRRVEQADERG